jgi:hypothetical protein
MTIQGLVSTLRPQADGRFLNTAPALGVGLAGVAFCVYMLMRDRK